MTDLQRISPHSLLSLVTLNVSSRTSFLRASFLLRERGAATLLSSQVVCIHN